MLKYRIQIVIVSTLISLAAIRPAIPAETWHLEQGQEWKQVQAQSEDKYLLAAAEIKNMVSMGETKAVGEAAAKLKKDFPEIAGPDVDAFMKTERLFCEDKFIEAVRGYDKFLEEFPESELYEAALERQFTIAEAFLNGRRKTVLWVLPMKAYAEGIKIMEKISDRAGDAAIGVNAAVAVAENYEKRKKLNEAYHKWSEISSRWPTGDAGKKALLGMARCKYAEYRGPKFNASNLISAKSYYENFKLRYPQEAEELGIDKILEQINEQLAYKYFDVGRYYQKIGSEQSANLYYQMVLDNWPGSRAGKKIKAVMEEKKTDDKKEKKWEEQIIESLEGLFL